MNYRFGLFQRSEFRLWFLTLTLLFIIVFASDIFSEPMKAAANSQTSVTLSWTAPGDDANSGQATAYSIRYTTSQLADSNWLSATEVSIPPVPQTAGATEQYDITSLTPGTLYYFAIKAVDEAGNWSPISSIVSASTDPETTPPIAVTDLQVVDSGSTTLSLSWTAPGDDGTVGTASQYDLRYSTSPINANNFTSATQVTGLGAPQAAGNNETVIVTGLTPSSQYYFALKTADEVPNWSTISNLPIGITTLEIIPPMAIVDLMAVNPTETTMDLIWTAPGDDSTTGQANQYDIRYSTSPITPSSWATATVVSNPPTPKTGGSSESFVVTSLNSATQYYFAIKTADEIPNWSGLSNSTGLSTTADQTPPTAISDLQVVPPAI